MAGDEDNVQCSSLADSSQVAEVRANDRASDLLQSMVHELETHQIELELQNRQLREAQGLIEQSRSVYADLYDSAPVAYLTLDRHGVIREINLTGASLLGLERGRLIGYPFTTFLSREGRRQFGGILSQHTDDNERSGGEFLLQTLGGTTRAVEMTCRWVHDAQHAAVCRAVLTDVSARKRAEQERALVLERAKEAREIAERACRIKDEFLATVSHELRSPLAALNMWSGVLRQPGADERTRSTALDAIDSCVRAQTKIVEDLLDLSRSMYGKLALDIQCVELRSIVAEAVRAAALAAAERDISIDFEADEAAVNTAADPIRLRQIADNLLANAIKFSSAGGRVAVTVEDHGDEVRFAVANAGRGIAPSFLPHVFDPFRQEDASSTRRNGGLGLGLAIVRELVILHHGVVEAASGGVGQGAIFTVKLPRNPDGPPASSPDSGTVNVLPAVTASGALRGLRVLVVEDDEVTREGLRRVLDGHGGDVRAVGSADEALRAFASSAPDVIVSDIAMPGRDGLSFIREIREHERLWGRSVPAVALTARSRARDREAALSAGFQAHLAKPVDPRELVSALMAYASPEEPRG